MLKLKQILLFLFLVIHLLLISFQGIYTTIDGYFTYHYDKRLEFPRPLSQNQSNEWYYILSGINTGYGFYGIKTSTKKYFNISFYDKDNNVLLSDRYLGLNSVNGIERLGGYSSYMVNYITDTEKLMKEDSLSKLVEFRKEYVTKSMKWLGKEKASKIPYCTSYKVELLTLVPDYYKDPNTKLKLYAIQSNLYRTE